MVRLNGAPPTDLAQYESRRVSADTYTVAEAATLLGVTPKRVRQMIAEGKLSPVKGSNPTRLPARAVIAARDTRKRKPATAAPAGLIPLADVAALIDQAREAAERSARLQLEAREAVEATLREALAEAQARAWETQARLEAMTERAATAEAQAARRSWLRR